MKKFLSIFLLLITNIIAFSQANNFNPKELLASPPAKEQLVNDFSNVLTNDQKQTLENRLETFSNTTSTQIAVVIVPTLDDYDINDYGVQLGRAWGIGSKNNNNGVILLIDTDSAHHKVNISTGYGLEGALPDASCEAIIETNIIPNFRNGDYYWGIDDGIDEIISATKGEYHIPDNYVKKIPLGYALAGVGSMVAVLLIIFFVSGAGGAHGFFGPFDSVHDGSDGDGYGGFGGGGFGGGGGGFGGFGGGGFGGGGASGSW